MFKGHGYSAILRELYTLQRLGMRTELGPVRRFLAILGNPHQNYPSLHVAGTNGKGSTTAMMAAALKKAGYRTGAYYSPHVVDYRERFLLDGRFFAKQEIANTLRWMGRKLEAARGDQAEALTFFEWSTALAFCLFARAKVDAAVLETGMGGRFDATSVATPEVAVITNVSLEHTKILGKTVREIAAEKAGIIKPGVPVVCGDTSPAVKEVVRRAARTAGTRAYFPGEDFSVGKNGTFTGANGERLALAPSMAGGYQLKNAAVAAQTLLLLKTLKVGIKDIEQGISAALLPGRFERTGVKGREVIFDVAHNPAATRELVKTLRTRGAKFDFVLGVLSDKDSRTMLKTLAPLARHMYCITPSDERATPAEKLAHTARALGIRAIPLENPKDIPLPGKLPLVITGSFTTVEAVKTRFGGIFLKKGSPKAPSKDFI